MKRTFDFVVAVVGLTALSPVLVLIGVVIRWRLGKPVLFCQARPGLHGQPFVLYKFRTMTNETDADGKLLPDDARLNSLGRALRSSSLDELPELFNVLKGEMSLVGPRPLLVEYLDKYDDFQRRRHKLRPGITGWAQVNGRNVTSWEEKLAMDVWYVENQSAWLDARILAKTLVMVALRRGISADGHVTAPKFMSGD